MKNDAGTLVSSNLQLVQLKNKKSTSKKHLIIALILAGGILSACSSSTPESVNSLPSWYITPKQNDAVNLYGNGEGFTVQEAGSSALKNMAAKLMVSISSESTMLLEENKNFSNEETRQKISESVAKISFNNYKTTNSAQKGGKVYVEISVNRDDFILDQKNKLEEFHKKMADLYSSKEGKSILEQRNILLKVSNISEEAATITRILSSLNVEGINLKKNIELYNIYQNAYENILAKIEFFVDADDNNSKKIGNILRSALNKERIKISKSKNLDNNNMVIIEIKSDAVNNNIYGAFIAKLKIDLALVSNKNKTISSNHIELSGSSRISDSEAINATSEQLSDKIKKDGVLKILGIEN